MGIEKLIKGFRKFRASYLEKSAHFEGLVRDGQAPDTLVIACSDSRNDPALLTKAKPGDMFVVRNVAAIVPPYQPDGHHHGTSAAIEFAVRGLKVKNIVVLGHALCGGVGALAALGDDKFEFLSQWISIGTEALETVDRVLPKADPEVRRRALEQAMILTSLNNLATFPWIKEAVSSGALALHGWYFDMVEGRLLGYDFAAGEFREIEDDAKGFSMRIKNAKKGGCCSAWPLEHLVKKHA